MTLPPSLSESRFSCMSADPRMAIVCCSSALTGAFSSGAVTRPTVTPPITKISAAAAAPTAMLKRRRRSARLITFAGSASACGTAVGSAASTASRNWGGGGVSSTAVISTRASRVRPISRRYRDRTGSASWASSRSRRSTSSSSRALIA